MTFCKSFRSGNRHRGPFDPRRPIAKRDLERILEAARWAPTAHNMQNFEIIVINNRKQLEAIGKIRSQVSEVFLCENFQQMSFTEEELRRKKVGVLARMFPPSWRSPTPSLTLPMRWRIRS